MENKIKTTLLAAALILSLSAVSAYANQMPNRDESKAAYCIGKLQVENRRNENTSDEVSDKGLSRDFEKELKDVLTSHRDKVRTDLARLQAFMAGRTKYLDPDSIQAALGRGHADAARFSLDTNGCLTTCRDVECLRTCPDKSAAGLRMKICNDLSFLPF